MIYTTFSRAGAAVMGGEPAKAFGWEEHWSSGGTLCFWDESDIIDLGIVSGNGRTKIEIWAAAQDRMLGEGRILQPRSLVAVWFSGWAAEERR